MSATQVVLLTVVKKGGGCFVHGAKSKVRLGRFIQGLLNAGSSVEVLRDKKVFDNGKVAWVGMHDGQYYFSGLERIVPSDGRVYRSPPISIGMIPELLPKWFQDGDVV